MKEQLSPPTSVFQALLTKIWCGELSVDNPVWRVLLCMVVFPLIYTGFLIFRSGLTSGREFRKAMWCERGYL